MRGLCRACLCALRVRAWSCALWSVPCTFTHLASPCAPVVLAPTSPCHLRCRLCQGKEGSRVRACGWPTRPVRGRRARSCFSTTAGSMRWVSLVYVYVGSGNVRYCPCWSIEEGDGQGTCYSQGAVLFVADCSEFMVSSLFPVTFLPAPNPALNALPCRCGTTVTLTGWCFSWSLSTLTWQRWGRSRGPTLPQPLRTKCVCYRCCA